MEINEEFIHKIIIPRKNNSRKGQNGIIGVVGGSRLYHGAPALSALAALRSGIFVCTRNYCKPNTCNCTRFDCLFII